MKKNIKFQSILVIDLLFALLFYLTSCDNNSIEPTKTPPVASFTFTADNGQHAPTNVDFANTSVNGDSFQWDFGNGDSALTSGHGAFTRYDEKGTYKVTLIATNAFGSDTTSATIVVTGMIVDQASIVGKWSIVDETFIANNDTVQVSQSLNQESLEFKSDGTYQRISSIWVEWETGTYTIVGDTISLHASGGNDTYGNTDIHITKLLDNEGTANGEVTMQEDSMTVQIQVLLEKNGPDVPGIEQSEFIGKWSITGDDNKLYTQSSDFTGEFTLGPNDGDYTFNVTHNYNTLDVKDDGSLLNIDNWNDGAVYDMTYTRLDKNDYWVESPDGEENLVQIRLNDGNGAIGLKVYGFFEDNGTTYRLEDWVDLVKNDGTEAGISTGILEGTWLVASKSETKDQTSLDPANQNGPTVGNTVVFSAPTVVNGYDTGTATQWEGGEQGSWTLYGSSDFVMTLPSQGIDRLYHVTDYDPMTGDLSLYSLWLDNNDNDAKYEMTLQLTKQ